jgi:hypothetical protein
MTALNFLFRKPRLPIIIDTGTGLIGAKSWVACEKLLAQVIFSDLTPRDVIDATAEAFSLYPEHMAFSPLTFKRRWTKTAIIELYNGSKGPGGQSIRPHRSATRAWRKWSRISWSCWLLQSRSPMSRQTS